MLAGGAVLSACSRGSMGYGAKPVDGEVESGGMGW